MKQFDLCRNLRWKTHSRSTGNPMVVLESLRRNQVPFTCLHTCQVFGPDDDLVAPELCDRSRSCYVPDPMILDHDDPGTAEPGARPETRPETGDSSSATPRSSGETPD